MPHAWKDNLARVKHPDGRVLIGGSFRGVPFFVDSHNREGGRRLVTHEIAKNDIPAYDDMGRKARVFRVTAYVLGDDYFAQRDALLSALEDVEGASELIHPYFGSKRVRAGIVTLRESVADGGIATFRIDFHDAPLSVSPTIEQDLASFVTELAAVAAIQNQVEFEDAYDVDGVPSFSTESLRGELEALSEKLETELSPVVDKIQELALLNVAVDLIIRDSASLVRRPEDVIDSFMDVVLQLEDTIGDRAEDVLAALMDAFDTDPTADVLGDTDTRVQERANQLAISDALRRALVIQAAVMIPDVTFETVGDATDLRDRIATALGVLASTAGDEAFPSLVDLRSAVVRAVPGDAILASVNTIHINTDQPSIAISYRLYGTADEEGDIVARNDVQHPAFISGDIEVLSFV